MLTSIADYELLTGQGDGVAERTFDELMQLYRSSKKNGGEVAEIKNFVIRNLHIDELFMQVIISRKQRLMGMNFGASFTDSGCKDSNYLRHSAQAAERNETYSAEEKLETCWADELVSPKLRYWSYRYDEEGDIVHKYLNLGYYFMLFYDITHTLAIIYALLPQGTALSVKSEPSQCLNEHCSLDSPRYHIASRQIEARHPSADGAPVLPTVHYARALFLGTPTGSGRLRKKPGRANMDFFRLLCPAFRLCTRIC